MNGIKGEFSIGEVAEATGLTVFALRQWERRYGSPTPLKRKSGHRRYPLEEILRLRLVSDAISQGSRASKVVKLSFDELIQLLSEKDTVSPALSHEQYLKLLKDWNQEALAQRFEKDWTELGAMKFLTERLGPFLVRVGESWQLGELSIAQEHLFSELIENFLINKWNSLSQTNTGEVYVVTSPQGEAHCIGLHMCAVVLGLNNKKILFLGASTPYEEIVDVMRNVSSRRICLGYSANYSHDIATVELAKLKNELGDDIKIIVGGKNAPTELPDVYNFTSLDSFADWLQADMLTEK